MKNLLVSAIDRPVDLDKVAGVIDFDTPRGKAFLVHLFTQSGRLSFVLDKASATSPPVAYKHDKFLLILSGAMVLVLDTTDITAGYTTIPIHFATQAARLVENGVVIIHDSGCTLLNPDLSDVLWSIDDPRIRTTRVDRGELRIYVGEHQSFRIDLTTGFEAAEETPTVLPDEDEDEDEVESNVVKLFSRMKR